MSDLLPDEWICRANCSFYKPNRTELERCRGYTLASILPALKPPGESNDDPEAFDSSFLRTFLRSTVCEACPFYLDGCDFTSEAPPENCLPCGGLIVLSRALRTNALDLAGLRLANLHELGKAAYLRISDSVALKLLEEPHVYDITKDELYEVNEDGFNFLKNCDGSRTLDQLAPDVEFLEYCVSENILEARKDSGSRQLIFQKSPNPSLRYLEWLVTHRCNLKCSHCYLGEDRPEDFPRDLVIPLLNELSLMQGLRVLVSGGEPTLYKHFQFLNEALGDFPLRFVLLSNGLAINDVFARELNFHEVQISLDGMKRGHDFLRGVGSYEKALGAMKAVRNAGIDLSVATMIHSGNIDEWDEMSQVIEEFDVREWSIDYPCVRGRYETHPELAVPIVEAAPKIQYGFGGSYHGSSAGWTCGRHLMAVLPSGMISRCGLFPEKTLGNLRDGLLKAWNSVEHIPLEMTKCSGCSHSDECGGGCRYRAGDPLGRDVVMCALYGEPVCDA